MCHVCSLLFLSGLGCARARQSVYELEHCHNCILCHAQAAVALQQLIETNGEVDTFAPVVLQHLALQ